MKTSPTARKKKVPGTPYVVDYQDPWVNDYYRIHPETPRPGGSIKYAVVDWLSRRHEPRVLKHCSGITSVSPDYLAQLHRRYPWLDERPELVLPFPGAKRDFDRIDQEDGKQSVYDPSGSRRNWVYVGRGGHDMTFALSGIHVAPPEPVNRLRGPLPLSAIGRPRAPPPGVGRLLAMTQPVLDGAPVVEAPDGAGKDPVEADDFDRQRGGEREPDAVGDQDAAQGQVGEARRGVADE